MPELPEVETTRQGITPFVSGASITDVIVRNSRLRWPIPPNLESTIRGLTIMGVERRAKYLLFDLQQGWLLWHLGMSGSLRALTTPQAPGKHDHVDISLNNGNILRYRDPRRFGCLLWIPDDWRHHALLQHLGPEPLSPDFTGPILLTALKNRKVAIKIAIMDAHIVVGVGNIYANEALFRAKLNPRTPAQHLTLTQCIRLVSEIKQLLHEAIAAGGSSLRDYVNSQGDAGYFQQNYAVYNRKDQACRDCATPISTLTQGQRTTFYCAQCQPEC